MIPQNQKLSSPYKTRYRVLNSCKTYLILLFILINSILCYEDGFSQQGWFWLNMSPYSSNFRSSFILNPNCAYLGNDEGILFMSYNYGSSLIPFNTGTGSSIQGIQFLNPLTGYIAVQSFFTGGPCGVLKTTNGGLTWVTLYNSQNSIMTCVYFINEQIGFAGGGYWTSLLKTTNGGINWTNVSPQQSDKPSSFSFVNETTGFAGTNAGAYGDIFKTTNQGENWSICYHLENGNSIPYLRFFNVSTGIAVTNEYPIQNRIIRTTDCGSNWYTVKTDSNRYYTSLSITNDSVIVITGRNGLLRMSSNRGLNWYDINCDTSKFLNTGNFLNYNTGFIAGLSGFYSKTTNHGLNWQAFQPALTSKILNSSFINSKTGYASAEGGNILVTKNGGLNWTVQNLNTTYPLVSVSFINAN